jgi:hypothetical protein
MPVRIPGMTAAEFDALAPHEQLHHSASMPAGLALSHGLMSAQMANSIMAGGHANHQGSIIIRAYDGVPQQSVTRRAMNSWMAFRCELPNYYIET